MRLIFMFFTLAVVASCNSKSHELSMIGKWKVEKFSVNTSALNEKSAFALIVMKSEALSPASVKITNDSIFIYAANDESLASAKIKDVQKEGQDIKFVAAYGNNEQQVKCVFEQDNKIRLTASNSFDLSLVKQ